MTVKSTAPVPEPPDHTSSMFVPTLPYSGVFETVSAAWATAAAAPNVKVFAALVADRNPVDAALVAVTPHDVAAVALNEATFNETLTEQLVPVTA